VSRLILEGVLTKSVIAVATSPLRHDARNKLAAIRQAAYYLSSKIKQTELWNTEPRVARFFEIIDQEVEALDAMVTGTAHAVPESAGSISPSSCVEAALQRLGPEVRARTTVDVQEASARGDAEDVALAIACLLENAAEAAPGPLRVEGRSVGHTYQIAIIDSGPGIPAGAREASVRPFHTTKVGHVGLGLSIADALARRLHGELAFSDDGPPHRVTLVVPSS
jgi:signal transduction histidine kinase